MTRALPALVLTILASCSGERITGDASSDDISAEDTLFEDLIEEEWEECEPRHDIDAFFTGPGDVDVGEVLIDSDALVTDVHLDFEGRTSLHVDFSDYSTELTTATFRFPGWVGETWDLAIDDVVHVNYHWIRWINSPFRLEIARDGVPIVRGYNLMDEDTFTFDTATFTIGTSDCEPYDDCGPRARLYYDVACPDLESPVRVLDGSSVLVPCGPGHQVAITELTQLIGEPSCTDWPDRVSRFLVVRSAE